MNWIDIFGISLVVAVLLFVGFCFYANHKTEKAAKAVAE